MAEKTLEIVLKARDQSEAAIRANERRARDAGKAWANLDRIMKRTLMRREARRSAANRTLEQQTVNNLQREVALGNKAAATELKRQQLAARFRAEKQQLLGIIRAEQVTEQQRIAARTQLIALERLHRREMAATVGTTRLLAGATNRAGLAVSTLVGTYLGFTGVRLLIGGLINDMRTLRDETIQFEQDITALLSLGDNINNIEGQRRNVLQLSTAWGTARKQIADTLFTLQSSTANLDDVTRNQLLESTLELTKVYSGDLQENLNAIVKTYQIAADQGESVSSVQEKLALAAEDGSLALADLSRRFPDVASKADAAGESIDAALAAIIVASQRGGDISKTFTSVGNLFLRMEQAQKKGIALTGSFTEKLRQLGELDRLTRIDIFGTENIAAANNLINAVDQVDAALVRLRSNSLDVGAKFTQRMEDATSRFAEVLGAMREANKNLDVNPGAAGGGFGRVVSRFEAAKVGTKVNAPFLGEGLRNTLSFFDFLPSSSGRFTLTRNGFRHQFDQAMAAGRFDQATIILEELDALGEDTTSQRKRLKESQKRKRRVDEHERTAIVREFTSSRFFQRASERDPVGAAAAATAARHSALGTPGVTEPALLTEFKQLRGKGFAGRTLIDAAVKAGFDSKNFPDLERQRDQIEAFGQRSQFVKRSAKFLLPRLFLGLQSASDAGAGIVGDLRGGALRTGLAGAIARLSTPPSAEDNARKAVIGATEAATERMLSIFAAAGDQSAATQLRKRELRRTIDEQIAKLQLAIVSDIVPPELRDKATRQLSILRGLNVNDLVRQQEAETKAAQQVTATGVRVTGIFQGFAVRRRAMLEAVQGGPEVQTARNTAATVKKLTGLTGKVARLAEAIEGNQLAVFEVND